MSNCPKCDSRLFPEHEEGILTGLHCIMCGSYFDHTQRVALLYQARIEGWKSHRTRSEEAYCERNPKERRIVDMRTYIKPKRDYIQGRICAWPGCECGIVDKNKSGYCKDHVYFVRKKPKKRLTTQ